MSADWKAGDRALCVEQFLGFSYPAMRPSSNYTNGLPVVGTIYLVDSVYERTGRVWLIISDKPAFNLLGEKSGWWSQRFRKITPACDRSEREQTQLHPHPEFWRNRTDL